MAGIGSMAMTQYRMAQLSTKYGMNTSGLYNKNSFTTGSSTSTGKYKGYDTKTINETVNKLLDGKSDMFKSEYKKLFNNMFPGVLEGYEDDKKEAEDTVSLKTASMNVANSSDSLTRFADSLSYGKDYDKEKAADLIEGFVKDYNSFIDSVGDSNNNLVLQKGVIMVNTAKVYTGALNRVGITLGNDNKLTFDKSKLDDKVTASSIRSTFGRGGFTSKVAQKAQQTSSLAGSTGFFSYSNYSTPSYSYNLGALFSTYA